MTVGLVPVVAGHGPSGVLTVGLTAGVILVALALLRHEGREYATTPEAIAAARDHLERTGALTEAPVPAPAREAP